MSLFLFDTDHLSLYQMGHPLLLQNVVLHVGEDLAISVITVEEQLTGWQRALRQTTDKQRREQIYRRMSLTVSAFSGWLVLPFTATGMDHHATLLRQRLNVGSNDLKIAAIAIETSATIVTRNLRDFGRVPGLSCTDWTVKLAP